MITLIQARSFRCLHYTRQELQPFQVLVGPNASGKTTFLDVVSFLSDVVRESPENAVRSRTQDFTDLVWNRAGRGFDLAIEARVPKPAENDAVRNGYPVIRYELGIEENPTTSEISIAWERVLLKKEDRSQVHLRDLFPHTPNLPDSMRTPQRAGKTKSVVTKNPDGNDYFYPEAPRRGGSGGWITPFRLGPNKSAFANLPEDETKFPAATWLKGLLSDDVQPVVLNSLLMRKASPPGQELTFKPDGSNLPWIVASLENRHPNRLEKWISHARTALHDLESVRTVERTDDRHRYLMLRYSGGLEVPSWMASDGTLRLLALTLPAYLPDFRGTYLIEEPENGIHPSAVETVVQSLSSVYEAQILLASHSPVVLSTVDVQNVLCFAKTAEGATDIVPGNLHPNLRNWHGEESLGVLFAAGVLG